MSFPEMNGAFWNLTDTVQLQVVTTLPVDYEAVDTLQTELIFDGVLEPLTGRQLLIKPEGERKFNYLNLWTEQDLKADSILLSETGEYYRVIKKQPWNAGDFSAYEIIQTPVPPYSGS